MGAATTGVTLGDRAGQLAAIRSERFDVLVIGGGITGAGVALDAAARNLRVGLISKGDFAGGTSGRSSKLIHGGLRYLPMLQFGLVREAAHERERLVDRLAPAMVRPLEFILPATDGGRGVGLGLWVYDRLGGSPPARRHRALSRAEVLRRVPALDGAPLRGGHSYWDARTDDTRLTLTVLKHAHARGAAVANYVRMTGFLREGKRAAGVAAIDELSGEAFEIRARSTVLAAGVWLDELLALWNPAHRRRITPARGVHLIVPAERLPAETAFSMRARDRRPVFAIPWHGRTLIGTTDVRHEGTLDDPRASAADVQYLLAAVNASCPRVGLSRDDILAVQAGLRPLIDTKSGATTLASREDRLFSPGAGIIAVAGGKLTTYRRMGERVVDAILREFVYAKLGHSFKRTTTDELRLTGPYRELDDRSLAALSRTYLAEAYGHDATAVLAAPNGGTPLRDGSPFVWGEVDYAVRHELAVHLSDVLARRTRLALTDRHHGRDIAAAVAARMGDLLGWDDARRGSEVAGYDAAAAASDVPAG